MDEFISWALKIGNPTIQEIRALWGTTKWLDKAIAEGKLEWSTIQPGHLVQPVGADVPQIVELKKKIASLQEQLNKMVQLLVIEPTLSHLKQDHKTLILSALAIDPQLSNLVRHAIAFGDLSAFQKACPACWLYDHGLNKQADNEARFKVLVPDKNQRENILQTYDKPLSEILDLLVAGKLPLVDPVFYTFRVMRTVLDVQSTYDRDYEVWYIGILESLGFWKAVANANPSALFNKELDYETISQAFGLLDYGNQSIANVLQFLKALGLIDKDTPEDLQVEPKQPEDWTFYSHLLNTPARPAEYPNDCLRKYCNNRSAML